MELSSCLNAVMVKPRRCLGEQGNNYFFRTIAQRHVSRALGDMSNRLLSRAHHGSVGYRSTSFTRSEA
jgi:hypothetical protein